MTTTTTQLAVGASTDGPASIAPPVPLNQRSSKLRRLLFSLLSIPLALVLSFALPSAVQAGPQGEDESAAPESCTDCHDQTQDPARSMPPAELLKDSIHFDMECIDCHESISLEDVDPNAEKPHGESVARVDCGMCHDTAAEEYLRHGRHQVGADPDLPTCADCHGAHDIRKHDDRQSRVHPINLPGTCMACHTNVNLVKKHEVLREAPIQLYESSVHGQASTKGLYVAATCNDCHSATDAEGNRTAHRVLDPSHPESTIHHFNIPDTCGQCHQAIAKDYWEGIHGKLVKQGQVDSPVCTHCHGEHGIISPSDPRSPVSAARVAEATCSPCHDSEVLNEKYGIPAGRLRSWVDSYHGLKSKAGDVHVANCASCHGAHRILPHTDPTSSINTNNLQQTCGECHPGITEELALTPIHETSTGLKTGWPAFFRTLYLWIISITIGLMVLHCVADLVRYIKIMRRKPYVVRMTPSETFQHWLLMISFTVLVISGFSLRFSEAWWVKVVFGWGGGEGFLFRGTVHRVAALLFAFTCVWHLLYLPTKRGRKALMDMIPTLKDLQHIRENSLYFLGLREKGPRFGRFSYVEKLEYWALVWGAVIMSVTGVFLWFDNYFVDSWNLPKGALDIMLVVHYYEAWLATLAIFVWHGYSAVFSPHSYPTNPAWISGTMPRSMYEAEHADGPALHARVVRVMDDETTRDHDPDAEGGSEEH